MSGLLKQRVMAEAEEGAGGIAWRLTGDRFVSSLSLRAAVGSTFTRWFSTQPVTAARPTSAVVSSTIRQRRSTRRSRRGLRALLIPR